MSAYRLLRSNKETGPYSAEELIAKGFKPYDLVWVVGKSAGWRYVSELPEFASLAPIVEEQPYDRFYKKSSTPKNSSDSITQKIVSPPLTTTEAVLTGSASVAELKETEQAVSAAEIIPVPGPIVPLTQVVSVDSEPTVFARFEPAVSSNKPASSIAAKKVHVVFPAGGRTAKPIVELEKEGYKKEVKNHPVSISSSYQVKTSPEKESAVTSDNKLSSTVFSPISNSHPIDRKEQLATGLHQKRASFSWMMVAASLIGIGTFVGLGLLVGLSIAGDSNDTKAVPALTGSLNKSKKIVPAAIVSLEEQTADIEPVAVSEKKPVSFTEQRADTRKAVSKNAPRTTVEMDNEKYDVQAAKLPSYRSPKEETEKNTVPYSDKDAENLIEVTTNTYSVGAFGGISNLQCKLVNNSAVSFETIEVAVEYLQANKKVYKREIIYFKDVRAGQQLVINAPKSSRGIKVVSKIVKATSSPSGYTSIKS
jgi:microcystin-dependent protein